LQQEEDKADTDLSDGPGATVGTPWGQASELRKRKLHPGSGTPRSDVIRNQRERLFGATVAVVSEKGYEATTVADVIELSGVSRSDFYKHFANTYSRSARRNHASRRRPASRPR
jgi:hypothetical protein